MHYPRHVLHSYYIHANSATTPASAAPMPLNSRLRLDAAAPGVALADADAWPVARLVPLGPDAVLAFALYSWPSDGRAAVGCTSHTIEVKSGQAGAESVGLYALALTPRDELAVI
jgi:hypothetical protein